MLGVAERGSGEKANSFLGYVSYSHNALLCPQFRVTIHSHRREEDRMARVFFSTLQSAPTPLKKKKLDGRNFESAKSFCSHFISRVAH